MLNRRNEKRKFDVRSVSYSMKNPKHRPETKVLTGADGKKWQLHWAKMKTQNQKLMYMEGVADALASKMMSRNTGFISVIYFFYYYYDL